MVTRARWTTADNMLLLGAVKNRIPHQTARVTAEEVSYALNNTRTIPAIRQQLRRFELASIGSWLFGDLTKSDGTIPAKRVDKLRADMVKAGFVIQRVGNTFNVIKGRSQLRGSGTSLYSRDNESFEFTLVKPNLPKRASSKSLVVPFKITVGQQWNIWSEYTVARSQDKLGPVQFSTVKRYLNGYVKGNKGYEKGTPKHFQQWLAKNVHLLNQPGPAFIAYKGRR